jgi:DNA (cytosine-5)-methyltransferase 1
MKRKIPCKKDDRIEKIIEKKVAEVIAKTFDKPSHNPTFIEVCSGCGGLSTGFIDAGFTPIILNEIDKTCCETLRNNHIGVNVVNTDMLELDLKPYYGKVDVLMGGVPCQAFSQAGERKGLEDPRGQLIIEFNRLVNECNPKILLVENVKGLTTHNNGNTLKSVIELFENNGLYRIYTKVLNAKDYEVPQKRERIIIIGVRKDILGDFEYPIKSDKSVVLRDVLSDVPPSLCAKYPEEKRKVMELVPQGGCWVNLPDDIKEKYMGQKSLEAGGGKRGIARRLAMNECSLTLTTSPCQKQTERCHPLETRPLSVREYARIQTFPDSYTFEGSMAKQYKQIGNAVPVKLAYAVGKAIKHFLDKS